MSENDARKNIEQGAREGLLRLGVVDDMKSPENPVEKYVNTYRKHITYQLPTTEDYISGDGYVILENDYATVDEVSEIFSENNSEVEVRRREILIYDEDEMVMPQIVEVEREESEDDEDDDEYEYTFTLHMAHQDSMWYLRNRLVSSQRLLLLFDVLILLAVSGSYYWYSNISTGSIFALGLLLLSTVTLLHLIILTILSFRL